AEMDVRGNVCPSSQNNFFDALARSLFDVFDALGQFEAVFVEGVEHMRDRDHVADVYCRLTECREPQGVDEGRLGRGGEIHRQKDVAPEGRGGAACWL